MQLYMQSLQQSSDSFIDVGFFDSKGIQIGYAGPYPYLYGKDYSKETWFEALKSQDRNYFISDIYLGFRKKPHFTIAVRQKIDGLPYIMRATLDPDKFYLYMKYMSRESHFSVSLINRDGNYQLVDQVDGELLEKSYYMPLNVTGSGVDEVKHDGEKILVVNTWLKETPWALILKQPLKIVYSQIYRTRNYMIIFTALIMAVIIGAIWLIVDYLIGRVQEVSKSKEDLQIQLIHASKLASVGELAAGVAHEINNPLAIIVAETGVIRDMLDPEFGMDHSPELIITELEKIDTAVFRARGITHKLLNFARKNPPRLLKSNINKILDNVVDGLKEKEFLVSNIQLVRDYDINLPDVLIDPDQISQVFLNLINNAGDAIKNSGIITLSTKKEDGFIKVSVTDNGVGMQSEVLKRIFNPFFTTKEVGKGTGLGLSISLGIVESMGGRIEVQSVQGVGSSFMVFIPVNFAGEREDGREEKKDQERN
jgi:two-component system, NtrC family, sensor kinase